MKNSRIIMPLIVGMYVTFTIGAMSLAPIVAADEAEDIPTNAQSTGVHDSLVAALAHANLVTALQADGPFTVFAPTDEAFAAAGIDLTTFDTDEENATLADILTYHVYSGSVESSAVTDGMTVTMLNGDEATFTVADGTVMIGEATVTTADVLASNGVIHVIDKVLTPPVDVTEADGDICYNIVTHTIAAGASFAECMAYAYYEDYEMNGQTFTGCYNTVTHTLTLVSQAECEAYMWTPAVDIAMTASATTIHSSLVAALTQANLVTALQADGPFTVFAPTDEAFAAAGIDLSTFDTDEENATLADILTYHVYSGSVASSAVTDGLTVTMLNGDEASFTVTDGVVMVGDATVTLADVPASNGVIHVIDKVLMPPVDPSDIPTTAASTGIHASLVAALTQANLVTALQADGPFTVFAPTDDAFAAAGIDLSTFDTDDEIAALADILTYHVYAGSVASSAVTDGLTVIMLNGDEATFTVADGTVMIGEATVTMADVATSNGIIHVIDKVLMPPADVVEPVIPDGCDYVIGIGDDGLAYDNTDLSIQVGQTVCWIWQGESMAHNVAEIANEGDTTRMIGGLYSGESMSTVDYRVTFDEDETFHYICEPHATMGMAGKVTVGTGVAEVVTPEPVEEEDNNTPGFTTLLVALAVMSAVLVTRRKA
ncbi:MAG: fasciclin domain-containing protein [Candidatus Thalassarchaeaceae archaeon]